MSVKYPDDVAPAIDAVPLEDKDVCWVSVSLTPVQGFIEAARTVRDLSVGSEILCYLTAVAIRAGMKAGRRMLYPDLADEAEPWRWIPNQFTIVCDASNAEDIAKAAVEAVNSEWNDLSSQVRTWLSEKWGSGWDGDWDEQIGRYWDVRAVTLCQSDATPEAYQAITPIGAHSVKRHWDLLAARLASAKQVRWFPGDHGQGRDKCSLLGDLEQMGPGGTQRDQRDWWRGTAVGTA